ncbi:hypothetical protein Tco_1022647 [Tanacetum coccineum]
MGDENPIRTLGDYSKPSHEGYRNTIQLPVGNNVVPFRSDTIRLVKNGYSFPGLRSEDLNQNFKDFLKLVDSLDLDSENRERTRIMDSFQGFTPKSLSSWHRSLLQVQIFYDHVNPTIRRTIDQSVGGKLYDKNAKESWALLEELALYENESWKDPRDFARPVKAISLPQDVPRPPDPEISQNAGGEEDDRDVMFIEIIKKYDDSHEEELEEDENVMAGEMGVEYFYIFLTRSELEYHKNEEDKRRGVNCIISKILGFYKECLELGPEYLTGLEDEGEVT